VLLDVRVVVMVMVARLSGGDEADPHFSGTFFLRFLWVHTCNSGVNTQWFPRTARGQRRGPTPGGPCRWVIDGLVTEQQRWCPPHGGGGCRGRRDLYDREDYGRDRDRDRGRPLAPVALASPNLLPLRETGVSVFRIFRSLSHN